MENGAGVRGTGTGYGAEVRGRGRVRVGVGVGVDIGFKSWVGVRVGILGLRPEHKEGQIQQLVQTSNPNPNCLAIPNPNGLAILAVFCRYVRHRFLEVMKPRPSLQVGTGVL